MNDCVREIRTEILVNSVLDSTISYLITLCKENPFDENLSYLMDDVKGALENYNLEFKDEEQEKSDVQAGSQEEIC